LYGYDNPAALSYLRQPDLLVTWNDGTDPTHRWGLFAAVPHFGFGMTRQKIDDIYATDYRISLSGGDRTISSGLAYGWTKTDNPLLDKSSLLIFGTLIRPSPYTSAGITYTQAINTKGYEFAGDIAVRPFGNEFITAFADYVMHRTPQLDEDMWSAGVAVEAVPGVRIIGRYFNTEAFTLGVQFSLGHIGVETKAHYNSDQKHAYNSYGVRLGAYDRNVMDKFFSARTNS